MSLSSRDSSAASQSSRPALEVEQLRDACLDGQPLLALVRLLETKIDLVSRLQRQLEVAQADRRSIADRLVRTLRAHPDGLFVGGVLYRAHRDGRGLDRIKPPSTSTGGSDETA